MPLSGHFIDTEGRVLLYRRRKTNSQMKFASEDKLSHWFPLAIQSLLPGHFIDIGVGF